MKRLLSLFMLLALFALHANGQTPFTATYNFNSVTTSSGTTDPTPPPTVTGLTFSSFVSTVGTNSSANARFSFTGWGTGATNGNDNYSSLTGTIDLTKYYQVTITPNSGYTVTIDSIRFTVQRSGTGIRTYSVRSSINSYASNLTAGNHNNNTAISIQPGNIFFWTADATTTAQTGSQITLGVNHSNLNSAVTFRFYAWNAEASTGTFSIDDVVFYGSVTALIPSITVSTTSLPSFGVVEVGNNSPAQTYTVSGDNLTGDVTVTAPAQFQVSTDNVTFSSSVTLTQSGGDLVGEPVTIYARFSPTSAGSASGNIMHTSPSATTQTVAVSGTGVNPPVTYTWNVDADGDFNVPTNWNPNRTTPAINDILVFNGTLLTGQRTISNLPASQTIGQLRLINNANIIFTADAANSTLTLDGNVTGVDFEIQSGSTLRLDTTSNDRTITINITSGETGTIAGTFEARGAAHQLLSATASSLTVSGTVNTLTGFSGNLFGTTNLNSVVFQSGSTYDQGSGSNPFGAGAPSSVVVWQPGSLYRFTAASGAPALSNRTYANFEYASTQTLNSTGTQPLVMNNLTVSSGTFNINLTGGVTINGNVSVSSGATLGFNPGLPTTITFGGTSQSLTNSGTLNFASNANVTVNSGSTLTLSSPVTINGNLTVNGTINTGSNALTVSSSSTVTNPQNIIGLLSIPTFNLPASTFFTNAAIGIDIAAGDALNNLSISRSSTPVTVGGNTGIARRWIVTTTTPSFAARNVSFYWPASADNGRNLTALQAWKSTDGGSTWFSISGSFNTSSDPRVVTVSTTSFSEFTVSDTDNPLPVELTSFTGVSTMRGVELAWGVASEQDNAGFIVFRDGQQIAHYNTTPELRGRGTTSEGKTYRYIDASGLEVGRTYTYTLRSVDFDGTVHTINRTAVVQVTEAPKVVFTYKLEQNYPNPFNPSTRITFSIKDAGFVSLKVYDLLGREVATLVNERRSAGIYDVNFNASSLGSGVYFYTLTSGGFSQTKKMMLVK